MEFNQQVELIENIFVVAYPTQWWEESTEVIAVDGLFVGHTGHAPTVEINPGWAWEYKDVKCTYLESLVWHPAYRQSGAGW